MGDAWKVVSVNPDTGVLGSMTAGVAASGWFSTHREDRIKDGVFLEYTPGEWVRPSMGKIFCFKHTGDAYGEYDKELKSGEAQLWKCEARGLTRIYTTSKFFSDVQDFWIGCGSSYKFPRSNDPDGGFWHRKRGIEQRMVEAPDGSYVCSAVKLTERCRW